MSGKIMKNAVVGFFAGVFAVLAAGGVAHANNVAVSNIVFVSSTSSTRDIEFTASQENTFNAATQTNENAKDCLWIFMKFSTSGLFGPWNHATINAQSAGTAGSASIESVSDKKGVFLFPNETLSSWSTDNARIQWECTQDGLAETPAAVRVKVCAIEMVYITTNSFTYNAGGIGGSNYNNFGAGAAELVDGIDDVPSGAANTWPNGYRAFYLMKYEVSQGQYADFLNTLEGAVSNTGTAAELYPNSNGSERHTINFTGTGYTASAPDRSCNYLCWDDMRAYLSWSALRPMTEMEFERACRGNGNTRTYPWGDTAPSVTNYSWDGITTRKYHACWGGSGYGPVDVGHYASGDVERTIGQTGVSPYGIADLAGNNADHIINCQWTQTPLNGDGKLHIGSDNTSAGSYYDDVKWPNAGSGKGHRGSCWSRDGASNLRASDRSNAGHPDTGRSSNYGVRGGRTP